MKSEERIKRNGEVFTPRFLVCEMLSKLPASVWEENKTFCDPSCGDGNFLIKVLSKKLDEGHDPLAALQSIFGADIERDNIQECRLRLLSVLHNERIDITEDHIKAVFKNIVWINIKKYPGGSLDYDFEFKSTPKKRDIDRWMQWVNDTDILNQKELPVDEEEFTPTGQLNFAKEEQTLIDFGDE